MSDYIPEGIQVQILKQLPVKSLLRFRCVCKWWKQYIDSPTFLQEHLSLQKPRFIVEVDTPEFLVLDPLSLCLTDTHRQPIEGNLFVVGTLHGVVCLYDLGRNPNSDLKRNVLLWNPSIRKVSSVPLPVEREIFELLWVCYGFWIDPSNKEFKIIVMAFVMENEVPVGSRYILYSSIRHDWSEISQEVDMWRFMQSEPHPPLMIGDVAHWVGQYDFENDLGPQQSANAGIMSFDFRQERFLDVVPIPNLRSLDSKPTTLHRCQGALSIVCWDRTFPHTCDLYSMQQGSWVTMFHFSISAPMKKIFVPFDGMKERGLALVEQDDAELKRKLVLYDIRAASCIPLTRPLRVLRVTCDFVESLLIPFE